MTDNIFVFGDSIAYGAWDVKGGWVDRLKQGFHETRLKHEQGQYPLVYNYSMSGGRTSDLLKYFDTLIKSHPEVSKEDIIIFAIGSNDCDVLESTKDNWTPFTTFKQNLTKLIKQARKYTDTVIFVDLIPADETKTTPLPWATDNIVTNKEIERYRDALEAFCKKNNVTFIPLFSEWTAQNYELYLEDGLHPNSEGHRMICEKVVEVLNPLIKKESKE